jgi:peroxiredoxin
MKKILIAFTLALSLLSASAFAAKVGEPAPAFTGTDTNGNSVSLSQYQGKYVVLEWHNKDCPYVKKQYKSGAMQKLQREWTKKGVVWLSIISSAEGKQGFETPAGANADVTANHAAPTATLLDAGGVIGKAYGALTTPHMFVINPKGTLVYNGAIDNNESTEVADIATDNYVSDALTQSMAGKPVTHASTRPYGCSVKY